jgi:hypothetical protein
VYVAEKYNAYFMLLTGLDKIRLIFKGTHQFSREKKNTDVLSIREQY